jgi:hypothetical protein
MRFLLVCPALCLVYPHRELFELNSTTSCSRSPRRARSFAQAIFEWTRPPRPQSVPAIDVLSASDFSECARSPRSGVAIRDGVSLLTKNHVELPGFWNPET